MLVKLKLKHLIKALFPKQIETNRQIRVKLQKY